jgi:uncharacterized protein YuzE
MKITYDREVDALYIRFRHTRVFTRPLGDGVMADYDKGGKLAGIEILDARDRLGYPQAFRRLTFEDVTRTGAAIPPWARSD